MARDSFVFHYDFIDEELLTPEEIGAITLAILHYSQSRTIPTFDDRALALVWKNIQKRLDADFDAYDEKCRINQANATKGGAPAGNQNARKQPKTTENNRTVEKTTENNPKQPDIDIESDIDTDIEVKEKTPKGVKEKARSRADVPTLEEVKEYCAERHNNVSAEHFIDYYQSQSWKKANGRPLTDWKAAVRTWEQKDKEKARSGTKHTFNAFEQRNNDMSDIEARMFNRRKAK